MASEIEYASVVDMSDCPIQKYVRQEYIPGYLASFYDSVVRTEVGPMADVHNKGGLDSFFRISQRGSTIFKEIIGGLTSFVAIAYILTLNGKILEPTGIRTNAAFFSTCLASGIFTILVGLTSNLPIILGPSLALTVLFREVGRTCDENNSGKLEGENCESWGQTTLPWSDVLGAIFLSGWFYTFFTFCGLRGYIYEAVPKNFRYAVTVGVGLLMVMNGIKIGQINRISVQQQYVDNMAYAGGCDLSIDGYDCKSEVDLGDRWYNHGLAHLKDTPAARIAILGIIFCTALEMFRVPGGIIMTIWLCSFIGINYYECQSKSHRDDDFSCVSNLSIWKPKNGGSAKIPFIVDTDNTTAGKLSFRYKHRPMFWRIVFSFLTFEMLDSYGSLTAVMQRMGDVITLPTVMSDRVTRTMMIDAFGVWLGAIIGCPSISVYKESLIGVEVGARTGLAAVVSGVMLLLCLLFVYPFVHIIPQSATTGAVVMVGIYMIQEYVRLDTTDYISLVSGFITIAIMVYTFSITNGICFGGIVYCWLQVLAVFGQGISEKYPYFFRWLRVRENTFVQLPHPVFLILSSYFAIRLALLKEP